LLATRANTVKAHSKILAADFETFSKNVLYYKFENTVSRYFTLTLALELPEIPYLEGNDVIFVGHLSKIESDQLLAFTLS
jgi:hypothetical protein